MLPQFKQMSLMQHKATKKTHIADSTVKPRYTKLGAVPQTAVIN